MTPEQKERAAELLRNYANLMENHHYGMWQTKEKLDAALNELHKLADLLEDEKHGIIH